MADTLSGAALNDRIARIVAYASPTAASANPLQVFAVEAYGAIGNGTTDDAPAIQAAINAAGVAGGVVAFGPKTYAIGSTLTVGQVRAVTLQGAGRNTLNLPFGTVLLWTGLNSDNWIAINGDMCSVKDMVLMTNGTQAAGAAIAIERTSLIGTRNSVENVFIYNCFNGVGVQGFNYCKITDTIIVNYRGSYGTRLYGDSTFRTDNFFMTRVVAQPATTNETSSAGFIFEGLCASVFVSDCYFPSSNYGIWAKKNGAGQQPGACRFFHISVEGCRTNGAYFESVNTVTITDSFVGTCGLVGNSGAGAGIRIGADTKGAFTFNNVNVGTSGECGIDCEITRARVRIANCSVASNSQNSSGTYPGIRFQAGCDGFVVTGGNSGGGNFADPLETLKQAYGIEIATTCVDFVINGVNLEGNVMGAVLDSSTSAGKITNCIGYESSRGATTNATGPNGSGNITIPHGLSKTPVSASAVLYGASGAVSVRVVSYSTTNLVVQIFDTSTGAAITTGTYQVAWSARTDRAG